MSRLMNMKRFSFRSTAVRLRTMWPRRYDLGNGAKIALPRGHLLDWYRHIYPRYDEPLRDVATLIARKYGRLRVIDIGANIGDSAALLSAVAGDVSVLCIEGNPDFLPYLRRNVSALPNVEVAPVFVGATALDDSIRIQTARGTAALSTDPGTGVHVEIRPLQLILDDFPKFEAFELLKIDTDGWDAQIILSAEGILAASGACVYFECDPTLSAGGAVELLNVYKMLCRVGYTRFHIFDNYGEMMLSLAGSEVARFRELLRYASKSGNRGKSVPYFDICAFSGRDLDLSDQLSKSYEL